jgi:hypothetical protein
VVHRRNPRCCVPLRLARETTKTLINGKSSRVCRISTTRRRSVRSKGRNKKGRGPAQANYRVLDPRRSRKVFRRRREAVLQDTMLMREKSEVMVICYSDDDASISYDLRA